MLLAQAERKTNITTRKGIVVSNAPGYVLSILTHQIIE
jgi:hypothetical protein